MLDFISTLGNIAAAFNATLIVLVAVFKPLRKAFIAWVQKQAGSTQTQADIKEIKEAVSSCVIADQKRDDILRDQTKALKCILRGKLTDAHDKYTRIGSIPQKRREEAVEDYTMYKAMGGNSYIDVIYPELLELPVDSSNK